jgi:hypothetical protein
LSLATGPTANCWRQQVGETNLQEQEATMELNGCKLDENIGGMYSKAVKRFVKFGRKEDKISSYVT